MIKVNGLDHINLQVRDLNKSVDFYKNVFGFQKVEEGISNNGNPYAIVGRSGHVFLAMYQGRDDNQSYINHLGFHIDDFDSVMEKINQLGVKISYGDGIIEYPDSRSVYIADPDGMQIELSEKFGGNL